jgi:hypothetical protein
LRQSITIHRSVGGNTTIHIGAMVEVQQREMEIERRESKAIAKRRHVILNRTTLLKKGIKILNPK